MRLRTFCGSQKSYTKYIFLSLILNVVIITSLLFIHSSYRYSSENVQDAPMNGFSRKPLAACSKTNTHSFSHTQVEVTIFTSFQMSKSKYIANKNALKNWKAVPGITNHVLFSNCSEATRFARSLNYTVLPVTDSAIGGVPVLSSMFLTVKSMFPSSYLMYSNGDILYELDLVDTVIAMDTFVKGNNLKYQPSLIVGQRTNLDIGKEESWEKNIKKAYKSGELFVTDAQDYFITNNLFPWENVPRFVIGRIGYDNWLVAFSRFENFTVIDATDTVLAVHQTISGANFEGFSHKDVWYNRAIIENFSPSYLFGRWGQTDCCYLATSHDVCNNVIVKSRLVKPKCFHYDILQKIKILFGF